MELEERGRLFRVRVLVTLTFHHESCKVFEVPTRTRRIVTVRVIDEVDLTVSDTSDEENEGIAVHRVVAEAEVANEPALPEGACCIDGPAAIPVHHADQPAVEEPQQMAELMAVFNPDGTLVHGCPCGRCEGFDWHQPGQFVDMVWVDLYSALVLDPLSLSVVPVSILVLNPGV